MYKPILAAGLVAINGSPAAQQLLFSHENDYWPYGGYTFEPQMEWLEDRDGDGHGEFLMGDYTYPRDYSFGKVDVISSLTSEVLFTFLGPLGSEAGFDVCPLGDLNGDRIQDFGAVGWNSAHGGVWIWSGKDNAALFHSAAPTSTIAPLGDVNADGLADFGMPGPGGIHVHAGGTFQLLYVARPDGLAPAFGLRIVSMGDADGDRIPDFAVSAPDDPNPFPEGCYQASIFAFSGRDGSQLYRILGQPPCDYLGYALAVPGDLNGDDVGDLAASVGFKCVSFFDGKRGAHLGQVCAPDDVYILGQVIEAVGDVNANGFGDVLVNAIRMIPSQGDFQGEAWLVDGGSRSFVYRVTNPRSIQSRLLSGYGRVLVGVDDWNRDGFLDLAVGSPHDGYYPLGDPGLIDVFSGEPIGVRSLGPACAAIGGAPRIGAGGVPYLNRMYELYVSEVTPGERVLLAVGYSPLDGRRSGLGFNLGGRLPGCPLLVSADFVFVSQAKKTTGKTGAATFTWKIGGDPALVGTRLYAQGLLPGAGLSRATPALEITIQAGEPPPYVP